jgi:hypothetical protein
MTPDPAGLGSVDLSDPQSLNRYGYVMNSPMNYVDPNGLDCKKPTADSPCVRTVVNVDGGDGSAFSYTDVGSPASGSMWRTCNSDLFGTQALFTGAFVMLPACPDSSDPGTRIQTQKAANNPKPAQCTNGIGAGITWGAALDAGVVEAGATANFSNSVGLFRNSRTGTSVGATASGAAMAYAGRHVAGAPSQGSRIGSDHLAVGAFGGAYGGVFFTNAGSSAQFATAPSSLAVDFGLGPALSGGNGTWSLSITGGWGWGLAVRDTDNKPGLPNHTLLASDDVAHCYLRCANCHRNGDYRRSHRR